MLYRKKILLSLIELSGGRLSATNFQKVLFIFCDKQVEKAFGFIPYKFGCFSFQSMADKASLIREGYLKNSKNWELNVSDANFANTLKKDDNVLLKKVCSRFSKMPTSDLIKYVYTNYPYFAINSEIAEKHLSKAELEIVKKSKPHKIDSGVFTIGYEGKSLEEYLNILIQNDIKVLCDVRKNPISRKYGFSKNTLSNSCESVGLLYIHIPELGIVSEKRKDLKSQKDYNSLFEDYEKTVIPNQSKSLKLILELQKKHKRIALTCFEHSPMQCHRTRVANAVNNLNEKIAVKHL